MHAERLL